MTRRRTRSRRGGVVTALRRGALLLLAVGVLLLVPVGPAHSHPLGNFTVNHYDGVTLSPDRIDVLAILDSAEIPTLQQRGTTDTDGNGAVSADEGVAHATAECAQRAGATTATVDGTPAPFAVTSAAAEYPVGEQGLRTTRVTCRLVAPADLSGPATVEFSDSFLADRIGWREITVVGAGLRIDASDRPAQSVSQELRSYPADLLTNPLDERSARIQVTQGSGSAAPLVALPTTGVSWLDSVLASGGRLLSGLAGSAELTPAVGALAVVMALVLGASHAMLPGHGKTVMAAYLAGKQGSRRDAVVVGSAVTVTHTAGVLAFGLLISLIAAFAPVLAMRWLGVVSGLLVAGVGVNLLRTALRQRREVVAVPETERAAALVGAATADGPTVAGHGHGHGHQHGHGHTHGHGHGNREGWSRTSLIGMGMAGGLVPSPTALLVLLGAMNLGRTGFGVALVLCYGLGMAATLTAAGLLLVSVRDRVSRTELAQVWRGRAGGIAAVLPVGTATLVLVVGIGLALRSVAG